MCPRAGLHFSGDVDNVSGSGVGGLFEVRVEDEVGSDNGSSVNNFILGGLDLEIGHSADSGGVEIYDIIEVELEVENIGRVVGAGVNREIVREYLFVVTNELN